MRVFWSRRRVLTEGVLSVAAALSLPRAFAHARESGAATPVGGLGSLAGPVRISGEGPAYFRGDAGAAPSASDASGALPTASEFGGRLTTQVRIDGAGPFHFLVDTGAERTVIADDLAQRLALPRGREVMVQGIVRGERANLVEIHDLEMGSLVCSRLQVPTLPRSSLNADGYLGLDVLDGRQVIFDFIAGTLTIANPRGFFSELWARFTRTDEVRVPTLGNSGRLRATDCLVDGVHAVAFLDTGAEVSVINRELYSALRQHDASQILPTREALTGVTGGTVVGSTTLLDMVRLGSVILTFTTAVVADLPVFRLWGLTQQPALLIGMDCLRRCARVTIDYRHKELRFQFASNQLPRPLEAGLPRPLAG